MSQPRVGYGCCVGSWDRFNRYVVPHAGGAPVLGLSGQTSIAEAYNTMLAWAAAADFDMLILQHDDLEIIDADHVAKFAAAFATDPDLAILGAAGGSTRSGLAWWNCNPIGHVMADSGMVDFGAHSGQVEALEGSLLVLSHWAILELLFDTGYVGFHGYDCDISAQARATEALVAVVDVGVHHHTTLGFKSAESEASWLAADERFRAKWGTDA